MTHDINDTFPDRVLFVDDDDAVRKAFARTLRRSNFTVDLANNAWAAMRIAKRTQYAVIVLDYRMPGLNGFEVKDELRLTQPDASYVLLSGNCDLDLTLAAVNEHQYSYVLQKPWSTDELISTINRAAELCWERITSRKVAANLVQGHGKPKAAVVDSLPEMMSHGETEALFGALGLRDPRARQSGRRVARYARAIAKQMAVKGPALVAIEEAALLRDIGHIGIPDSILKKRGELTDEDWSIIRRHPQVGARLMEEFPELDAARIIVLHHHEAWSGGGYPNKLEGEAIAMGARIVAVAAAFEAMCMPRPYRAPVGQKVAREEIRAMSGIQFDPKVVAAFCHISDSQWDALAGAKDMPVNESDEADDSSKRPGDPHAALGQTGS